MGAIIQKLLSLHEKIDEDAPNAALKSLPPAQQERPTPAPITRRDERPTPAPRTRKDPGGRPEQSASLRIDNTRVDCPHCDKSYTKGNKGHHMKR